MCRYCTIVPRDVLLELAKDKRFSDKDRKGLLATAKLDLETRKLREQARKQTRAALAVAPAMVAIAAAPKVLVYDCQHSTSIPGTPANNPGASTDPTIKRTFDTTTQVANFYQQVYGRNSIDNAGMTMVSSVHYGIDYNNAFWNGLQMTYGDGNGLIFTDFTLGEDVVCHELTHGVTQYTSQFVYTREAGGLNESMSDVFGVLFSQWRNQDKPASANEWRVGKDIMGTEALNKGLTCLRDMSNPGAAHCMARQPMHFNDYVSSMGPHTCSGIPNHAFYKAASAIDGPAWNKPGKIWYDAMTSHGPAPNSTMKKFADRTRASALKLYPTDAKTQKAVDAGWAAVGL
jgi:Zn-dependent metalloprotease